MKKIMSLLLAGAMSLSLMTTVFSEEIVRCTFATDTEGWIGNVNNNATIPNNANHVNTVDHTGDDSGALEFSLYHTPANFISQFGQHAYLGVGKQLSSFSNLNLAAGKVYKVSAYIKNHDTRYMANKPFYLGITKRNDKDGSIDNNIVAYGSAIPNNTEWTRISFNWEPTEINTSWYVRLFVLNGDGRYSNKEAKVTYTDDNPTYDILYIDDVEIKEVNSLELTYISLRDGMTLYAADDGFSAEFSLVPDKDNCEVTVKNSSGITVPIQKSVSGTTLNVSIPNRKHGETYTVTLGKMQSVSGLELDLNSTYTFTADATIMNTSFDSDLEGFVNDDTPGREEWTADENHTEGKASGAVRLGTWIKEGETDWAGYGQSSYWCIEKIIGGGIKSGEQYMVSAYVKGEPGRHSQGLNFQIAVGKNPSKDSVGQATVAASDEWQKMTFIWKPTGSDDFSNYAIRISPVNGQKINSGLKSAELYEIYYIDDISIEKFEPMDVIASESYPSAGETDVSVSGEYTIKFDRTIDTSAFKSEYVKVYDVENDVYIDCEAEAEGSIINIKTAHDLLYEHEYKILLDAKISELGNSIVTLDETKEINFVTENNAITYSNVSDSNGKITLNISNNTDAAITTAYAVASVYENTLLVKTVYTPISLSAGEQNKPIEIDTELSDISDYELYFWNKVDGEEIKSLANAKNIVSARTQITAEEQAFQAGYLVSEDIVELKGQIKLARVGLPVIVRVVKETDAADGVVLSELIRAEEIISGADGYVAYSFKIPAQTNALRYKVYINQPTEAGETELTVTDFVYASTENIEAALREIDSSNVNNMHTVFTDTANGTKFSVRETLNLMNDSDFDKISNKDYVYKCIQEGKSEGTYESRGIDVFTEIFRRAVKTAVLAEGEVSKAVSDMKDNHAGNCWNISKVGETSTLKAFLNDLDNDTRKKVLAKLLLNSNGFNDNERAFNLAVVIENILSGDYNTVYSILSKFSDLMTVDYTNYNALLNKDTANSEFYNSVGSLTSLDAISDKFEEIALRARQNELSLGGNSGSSGSTGGSGGGGVVILPGKVQTSNEAPDWYVDENADDSTESVFSDLNSVSWAIPYINKLYNMSAVSGKAEGIFAPNDNMTREELCKVIVLAFGLEKSEDKENPQFEDIDQSQWYAEYIGICAQNGVINGIGNNLFGLGKTVTREEASTILVRAAEAAGISLDYDITIFPFEDDEEISQWAKPSVSVLYESLIIDGVGDRKFAPKNNVTRAQAAKMIVGVIDYKY